MTATVIDVGRVPSLVVKKPGLGVRALGLVSSGVRRVNAQVEPYTRWWDAQNQTAGNSAGPLWVVLGDSTSIGIGASAPDRGYVGVVAGQLRQMDPSWQVINLAMSGARVSDGLDRQLPILDQLPRPTLVTLCLGSNDVFWDRSDGLEDRLRQLVAGLPPKTHVAAVAGMSERARRANRVLRRAALDAGHEPLNPWNWPGSGHRLADDRFHPNDLGYHYMAQAFAQSLGVDGPSTAEH